MVRLLDLEEIIRVAKNTFPNEDVLKIAWVITHTPTAYDVEKVVAEIKKLEHPYDADCWFADRQLRKAIDIVRKGGIE